MEQSNIASISHLPDHEIILILKSNLGEISPLELPKMATYDLTFGLLLLAYRGCRRIVKRNHYPRPHVTLKNESEDAAKCEDTESRRIYQVVTHYTCQRDKVLLLEHFPEQRLYETAYELSKKSLSIHPKTLCEFHAHPLYPPDADGKLQFDKGFLLKVAAFHESVKRPDGTYNIPSDPRVSALVDLPREKCPQCEGSRQLYCGDCAGIRTPSAEELLPPRLTLPFNVLLLVHYNESLHKCTGAHVGCLCVEGTLEVVHWPRPHRGGDIQSIITALDPNKDVLLFPCDDALNASHFDWIHTNDRTSDPSSGKKRLVVLEASWSHGKTMAHQIQSFRSTNNLPPIPCVRLEGVVGQYWRFHFEGNAAVSTIEAISYAAHAAGVPEEEAKDMTILFQVQKHRVLSSMNDGGKAPQAILVSGSGVGSWKEFTDSLVNTANDDVS